MKEFIPYESATQKDIISMLQQHPLVAWAGRVNSGMAMMSAGKNGRMMPVRFNTITGISDIIGQMKDGRFLSVEVKRLPWTKPKDDHENKQAFFINRVNDNGGVAFFATSVDDAKTKLESKTILER